MIPLDINCATCNKLLAEYVPEKDHYKPSCEEIFADGAVPIPNFGWFCNQECGTKWEIERGRTYFQRDETGDINYEFYSPLQNK